MHNNLSPNVGGAVYRAIASSRFLIYKKMQSTIHIFNITTFINDLNKKI